MKKKSNYYPVPTPEELQSSCIRCGKRVIQADFKDKPVLFARQSSGQLVMDFDQNTGRPLVRRRMIFEPHRCSSHDLELHRRSREWHEERAKGHTVSRGYRPGDKMAHRGLLDDSILRTYNYACSKCGRSKGEACRSMVKYKDDRIVDNKHPHIERQYTALKSQNLRLIHNGKYWLMLEAR